MPQYFSPTDTTVSFINHPGGFNGEIDAAQFILTAGESPIHIWNYAYRDSDHAPAELQSGTKGGALFDDTAVSTHFCQLQIVLNMDRFKSLEYAFAAMTRVGDVQIRYAAAASWDVIETAGYRLVDGHVAQAGKEIEVRSASFPTITLQFKQCLPLGEAVPLYRAPEVPDTPLIEPRGAPGELYIVDAYALLYEAGSVTRPYDPVWFNGSVVNPTLLGDVIRGGSLQLASKDPLSDIAARDYTAPVLEVTVRGRRHLFAWHPNAGYTPAAEKTDDGASFLQGGLLTPDLRSRLAGILFAQL